MPPKILNLYFRASKDVLQKAREKCVNRLNAKTVYDKKNKESGGVYSLFVFTKQWTMRHTVSATTKRKSKND